MREPAEQEVRGYRPSGEENDLTNPGGVHCVATHKRVGFAAELCQTLASVIPHFADAMPYDGLATDHFLDLVLP